MKRVAVLGVTGSIGRQALEIVESHPELELAAAASGSQPIDGLAPLTQVGGDLTELLDRAEPDVVLNAVGRLARARARGRRFRLAADRRARAADAGRGRPHGAARPRRAGCRPQRGRRLRRAACDPLVARARRAPRAREQGEPRGRRGPGAGRAGPGRRRAAPGRQRALRSLPVPRGPRLRGSAFARAHGLGRAVPQAHARRARGRDPGRGARAPDLADGPEDHDRLGDAGQQGPRADRGAFPLRAAVRADRGRAPAHVGRARARALPRRRFSRASRLSGHARADLIRPHLPGARGHGDRAARLLAGTRARVRGAGSRDVPAPGARATRRRAGRNLPLRVQCRERGGGCGVPRGQAPVPRHRGHGRRDAGRCRGRSRARPRRSRRRRRRGAQPRREGARRMTVFIALLGLGFLILIHEAGHFFTALAVGMRPRRFYVGFPPALVKTKQKGVEYGLGAIPLGGYVKIPGMHRPAPSDLDVHFGTALYEAPQLLQPIERVKRPLAEGEFESARAALRELEAALSTTQLSGAARRQANRGLNELDDALGPDAYWRQRTWRKLAVISAGPLTNLVFAILLLAVVYMIGIPSAASRRVDSVDTNTPAAKIGLKPGDVVIMINHIDTPTFDDVSSAIRGSGGEPLEVTVLRDGRKISLPGARPLRQPGGFVLGFRPAVIRYKHYSPPAALRLATGDAWTVTKTMGNPLPPA